MGRTEEEHSFYADFVVEIVAGMLVVAAFDAVVVYAKGSPDAPDWLDGIIPLLAAGFIGVVATVVVCNLRGSKRIDALEAECETLKSLIREYDEIEGEVQLRRGIRRRLGDDDQEQEKMAQWLDNGRIKLTICVDAAVWPAHQPEADPSASLLKPLRANHVLALVWVPGCHPVPHDLVMYRGGGPTPVLSHRLEGLAYLQPVLDRFKRQVVFGVLRELRDNCLQSDEPRFTFIATLVPPWHRMGWL